MHFIFKNKNIFVQITNYKCLDYTYVKITQDIQLLEKFWDKNKHFKQIINVKTMIINTNTISMLLH